MYAYLTARAKDAELESGSTAARTTRANEQKDRDDQVTEFGSDGY